jgi:signal transduction histidine kinase
LVRTLDLSRLQSGRHPFQMEPIRVDELVAEAIAAFDVATLGEPTPIATDLGHDLVVRGDRVTLVRAIVNLLVNAWKYSGDDKEIRVVARGAGRRLAISVIDNGIGIDPAERHELFDGFVRGKAAVDSRKPGVGLGLAIVRAIVQAHKGKIEVESAPDHGSTFRLLLPRANPTGSLATIARPTTAPAVR